MSDQKKQDEYERTFNLSGNEPQKKLVEFDHILFQITQFMRGKNLDTVELENFRQLKQYLIEQNK